MVLPHSLTMYYLAFEFIPALAPGWTLGGTDECVSGRAIRDRAEVQPMRNGRKSRIRGESRERRRLCNSASAQLAHYFLPGNRLWVSEHGLSQTDFDIPSISSRSGCRWSLQIRRRQWRLLGRFQGEDRAETDAACVTAVALGRNLLTMHSRPWKMAGLIFGIAFIFARKSCQV